MNKVRLVIQIDLEPADPNSPVDVTECTGRLLEQVSANDEIGAIAHDAKRDPELERELATDINAELDAKRTPLEGLQQAQAEADAARGDGESDEERVERVGRVRQAEQLLRKVCSHPAARIIAKMAQGVVKLVEGAGKLVEGASKMGGG